MHRHLGLLLLAVSAISASPITIISNTAATSDTDHVTGPNNVDFHSTFIEVGWQTGPSAYNNVMITASLEGTATDLIAYLTSTIGAGTTAAVATSPLLSVNNTAGPADFTLFTGLSLSANTTYYLTLAPSDAGELFWDEGAKVLALDSGVSYLTPHTCNDDVPNCAAYPPASPGFTDINWVEVPDPIFAVTGDQATGVPEPGSLVLAGTVLAAGALWRRK